MQALSLSLNLHVIIRRFGALIMNLFTLHCSFFLFSKHKRNQINPVTSLTPSPLNLNSWFCRCSEPFNRWSDSSWRSLLQVPHVCQKTQQTMKQLLLHFWNFLFDLNVNSDADTNGSSEQTLGGSEGCYDELKQIHLYTATCALITVVFHQSVQFICKGTIWKK